MRRREFVIGTTLGAIHLSLAGLSCPVRALNMGVVVHSYSNRWNSTDHSEKYPAFTNAIDLMEHCHAIGAGGIQVGVSDWSADFGRRVRDRREKLGLYIEGSIGLPRGENDLARFESDLVGAREAGAQILRTVCLGTRRYETFGTKAAFEEFKKRSVASLQLAEPVLRRHRVRLAVENHKDWRGKELLEIIKTIDSEWVGITLDFGNNVALLEDPIKLIGELAPYSFSTHVKDMGVSEYTDGFLLSEVPLGQGIVDLPEAFRICMQHNSRIAFNLEMITRDPLQIPCLKEEYWATFDGVPGLDLAGMLRTVRSRKLETDLPRVSHLTADERLGAEEKNVIDSLAYARGLPGFN